LIRSKSQANSVTGAAIAIWPGQWPIPWS